MRPTRSRLAALLAAALVLGACGALARNAERRVMEAAIRDSRAVTFPSADGVQLAGRIFGPDTATSGVVLAHMFPADQTSWFEFADILGAQGYRALTFDFRGYCPGGDGGCSQGEKDVASIWQDVQGAVEYVRSQGVKRVALVGASMGGTASLIVASRTENAISAVVTLSAPQAFEGLVAGPDVLQTITAAKLFVAGNGDLTGAANAATAFYDQGGQPKRLEILPSNDHGTDLLNGNQGPNVRQLILTWLTQYLR